MKLALALGATVLLWSSAFPGIRAALPYYGPMELVLLRFLVASAALAVFLLFRFPGRPQRRDLPRIVLTGAVSITFYHAVLNTGMRDVTAGAASLIINAAPIWTALLAAVFLKERLRPLGWGGVLMGFAGVVMILIGQRLPLQAGPGAALVVVAAWAHSVSFLLQKPLLERYRALDLTAWLVWTGTLLLLPFGGGLLDAMREAPASATWTAVYLGVGPAAVAYVTWAYALARLPASRAASFLYFVPVSSFALAWWWLGEVPRILSVVGGIVAIGGVALVHAARRPAPVESVVGSVDA